MPTKKKGDIPIQWLYKRNQTKTKVPKGKLSEKFFIQTYKFFNLIKL